MDMLIGFGFGLATGLLIGGWVAWELRGLHDRKQNY